VASCAVPAGFPVVEERALLTRAAAASTSGRVETIVGGTEVILNLADAPFSNQGVMHVVRNTDAGIVVPLEAQVHRAQGTLAICSSTALPDAGTPGTGPLACDVTTDIKNFADNRDPVEVPVGGTVTGTDRDVEPHTTPPRSCGASVRNDQQGWVLQRDLRGDRNLRVLLRGPPGRDGGGRRPREIEGSTRCGRRCVATEFRASMPR